MAEHLAEQGVVHAEVYISVGVIYMWRNHDPHSFEPIFAGLERAASGPQRELGLSIYWIFDAVRHFTVAEAERVFQKAAEMRAAHPSIIGIGLGGDERRAGSEAFRELYAQARAAGLRLTNHAGETTGPEAIWEALAIGSERIGHALSAVDDSDSPPGVKSAEHAAGDESNFERADRGLRFVCSASAAPLLRSGAAGDHQLRRSCVFWIGFGQ